MPKYAAFLRGINLGSRRRVGSAELRACFEALGFDGVSSFRTSGNVVFEARREPAAAIAARIERGLAESLGYEIAIFLRDASEIRALAADQPFPPELVAASNGKLQVALLASKPTPRTREQVTALATEDDKLAFGARELYWLPAGGIRDSALGMKKIEQAVGSMTMRTKGTIEQLATKQFAD